MKTDSIDIDPTKAISNFIEQSKSSMRGSLKVFDAMANQAMRTGTELLQIYMDEWQTIWPNFTSTMTETSTNE